MVVENRVAGRLMSYLAGALSGGNLQQKRSFLEERKTPRSAARSSR